MKSGDLFIGCFIFQKPHGPGIDDNERCRALAKIILTKFMSQERLHTVLLMPVDDSGTRVNLSMADSMD